MNKDARICDRCGGAYMPYGTQIDPEANRVDLTFEFPNGKGLTKIKKYCLCECCMYAVKCYLDGDLEAEDLEDVMDGDLEDQFDRLMGGGCE